MSKLKLRGATGNRDIFGAIVVGNQLGLGAGELAFCDFEFQAGAVGEKDRGGAFLAVVTGFCGGLAVGVGVGEEVGLRVDRDVDLGVGLGEI